MKISRSLHFVEVYTSVKTYVYFVSPLLCRIDAVDDVLSRHQLSHPEHKVLSLKYFSEVVYKL